MNLSNPSTGDAATGVEKGAFTMPGVNRLSACLLTLLLLVPTLAIAANDIKFTSTAEIEVQQVNAKGEKATVRQPATLLQPGQIAIYTNSFTNVGTQPAEKVVVNNPVPTNTEYLGGTATEAGYDVVFSVDKGQSFGKPKELTVPDGKGGKRPAEPKEYTNLRWTMQAPLKPGATGVIEFRVRVR
jgi:uncharacterized repeat protein (TIGR01451 family)